MINWEYRVRVLEDAARHARYAEWAGDSDPGEVPGHVIPALCSLAARLGYPVRLAARLPQDSLGTTSDGPQADARLAAAVAELTGRRPELPRVPRGITLLDGMTPASTARTLGHEIGHALAAPGRNAVACVAWKMARGEHTPEELGCELGTGAFCAAHGIGTGAFCAHYVGGRLRGAHAPEESIRQAARLAAALHEAVSQS